MNQLVPISSNVEAYRESTDAAEICKAIVVQTASTIQGRKYVGVEGWQAIARAHGCCVGARDVERVDGGVRAVGEVRHMATGVVIATGEGFVGEDEPTWYGGVSRGKTLPKRADYAIRAMAQTRAMSRACRSAFAHVVVMMNAGLATTPAEEVPYGGFDDVRNDVRAAINPPPNETPHNPETGEIIEAQAEKVPGIQKIKDRLRPLQALGDSVINLEGFNTLVHNHAKDLTAIKNANHSWWTGDGEDFEGFKAWIVRRRGELAEPAEDSPLQGMIRSMKETETKRQLVNWMEANEKAIEQLEDADGRSFQLALAMHESAIELVDAATAGG